MRAGFGWDEKLIIDLEWPYSNRDANTQPQESTARGSTLRIRISSRLLNFLKPSCQRAT